MRVIRFTCDGCGRVKESNRDELPNGWIRVVQRLNGSDDSWHDVPITETCGYACLIDNVRPGTR